MVEKKLPFSCIPERSKITITGDFAREINDEIESLRRENARLRAVLGGLVIEIEGTPEHGIDAHDDTCPVCQARAASRAALDTP